MVSSAARSQFCNHDEFLLFVDQFDCQITHEAELRPLSLDDAAIQVEDTTLRIIRMDHSTWTGEDVSEEIAHKWLSVHVPSPDDETRLPDFVVQSEAWLAYCDEYEADDIKETRLDDFDLGVGKYAS